MICVTIRDGNAKGKSKGNNGVRLDFPISVDTHPNLGFLNFDQKPAYEKCMV